MGREAARQNLIDLRGAACSGDGGLEVGVPAAARGDHDVCAAQRLPARVGHGDNHGALPQ